MYSQPVHSSMSCIHCLLGLPRCRNPSMIPSRTVSVNCPALPRVIWPKYCSFSFATLIINSSLSRHNSVNIESFVRCSCHEMLSIFLQHHISKASILFLSDFCRLLVPNQFICFQNIMFTSSVTDERRDARTNEQTDGHAG